MKTQKLQATAVVTVIVVIVRVTIIVPVEKQEGELGLEKDGTIEALNKE